MVAKELSKDAQGGTLKRGFRVDRTRFSRKGKRKVQKRRGIKKRKNNVVGANNEKHCREVGGVVGRGDIKNKKKKNRGARKGPRGHGVTEISDGTWCQKTITSN